jgi:phasin family protein
MNLDKIVAAHKVQLIAMHEMTSNALAAVEKIAELNLQAAKASLEHHTGHAHELLSVKDVKALSRLQAKALEPLAEKAAAYNRSLYEIVSDMNSECASIAQAQIGQAQKQFLESVETALSHVPMGSDKLVDSVKTAVNDTDQGNGNPAGSGENRLRSGAGQPEYRSRNRSQGGQISRRRRGRIIRHRQHAAGLQYKKWRAEWPAFVLGLIQRKARSACFFAACTNRPAIRPDIC